MADMPMRIMIESPTIDLYMPLIVPYKDSNLRHYSYQRPTIMIVGLTRISPAAFQAAILRFLITSPNILKFALKLHHAYPNVAGTLRSKQ